ncbi:MAG: hypothetical protein ACJAYU_001947 [Bradymonadia bacterium]|jgi:hypothetical protein
MQHVSCIDREPSPELLVETLDRVQHALRVRFGDNGRDKLLKRVGDPRHCGTNKYGVLILGPGIPHQAANPLPILWVRYACAAEL